MVQTMFCLTFPNSYVPPKPWLIEHVEPLKADYEADALHGVLFWKTLSVPVSRPRFPVPYSPKACKRRLVTARGRVCHSRFGLP